MALLKEKDMNSKYKRYWIVESDKDIAADIKLNTTRLKGLSPKTHDFTTMYTRLPHQEIKDKVNEAIKEAFEFKNIMRLESNDPATYRALSQLECRALLSFCVDNSLISMRGKLWRQVVGIPMGGNASSDIANLYCYRIESKFMDDLVAKGELDLARKHDYSCRYIDDFLTWNCIPPPAELYSMNYTETSNGIDDVSYIGIRIRIETTRSNNRWIRLSVNDKARGWHIIPTRFTHQHSAAQESMGTGIFTTMLLRALRICNNQADLLQELEFVTYRLLNRGYKFKNLAVACHSFINLYIDDGNVAAAIRRRLNITSEKFNHGIPVSDEKDTINHKSSTLHTLDKRFPIQSHQSSGEGLIGGECGWASLNFVADHLYLDRINFSYLQELQQTFYEEHQKVEPGSNEQKPSPDGWFSLTVLGVASKHKLNREIHQYVDPSSMDYPTIAAAFILNKAGARMSHYMVALVSFDSIIVRDILKGATDRRLSFDHFDRHFKRPEYCFHMILRKTLQGNNNDNDCTMAPSNEGILLLTNTKEKRKKDDYSSDEGELALVIKRTDVEEIER